MSSKQSVRPLVAPRNGVSTGAPVLLSVADLAPSTAGVTA